MKFAISMRATKIASASRSSVVDVVQHRLTVPGMCIDDWQPSPGETPGEGSTTRPYSGVLLILSVDSRLRKNGAIAEPVVSIDQVASFHQ